MHSITDRQTDDSKMPTADQGPLNIGRNDTFCVIGNVGGKLKYAATRCLMRAVDASKCVCGQDSGPDPSGGAYSAH